jgi:hypothetical protein
MELILNVFSLGDQNKRENFPTSDGRQADAKDHVSRGSIPLEVESTHESDQREVCLFGSFSLLACDYCFFRATNSDAHADRPGAVRLGFHVPISRPLAPNR